MFTQSRREPSLQNQEPGPNTVPSSLEIMVPLSPRRRIFAAAPEKPLPPLPIPCSHRCDAQGTYVVCDQDLPNSRFVGRPHITDQYVEECRDNQIGRALTSENGSGRKKSGLLSEKAQWVLDDDNEKAPRYLHSSPRSPEENYRLNRKSSVSMKLHKIIEEKRRAKSQEVSIPQIDSVFEVKESSFEDLVAEYRQLADDRPLQESFESQWSIESWHAQREAVAVAADRPGTQDRLEIDADEDEDILKLTKIPIQTMKEHSNMQFAAGDKSQPTNKATTYELEEHESSKHGTENNKSLGKFTEEFDYTNDFASRSQSRFSLDSDEGQSLAKDAKRTRLPLVLRRHRKPLNISVHKSNEEGERQSILMTAKEFMARTMEALKSPKLIKSFKASPSSPLPFQRREIPSTASLLMLAPLSDSTPSRDDSSSWKRCSVDGKNIRRNRASISRGGDFHDKTSAREGSDSPRDRNLPSPTYDPSSNGPLPSPMNNRTIILNPQRRLSGPDTPFPRRIARSPIFDRFSHQTGKLAQDARRVLRLQEVAGVVKDGVVMGMEGRAARATRAREEVKRRIVVVGVANSGAQMAPEYEFLRF